MSSDNRAVWTKKVKGKPVYITGSWSYNWAADSFSISIDRSKHTSGIRNHDFRTSDDHPVFGDWNLVEGPEKIAIYKQMRAKELKQRASRIHKEIADPSRFGKPRWKSDLCDEDDCKICTDYYRDFIQGR